MPAVRTDVREMGELVNEHLVPSPHHDMVTALAICDCGGLMGEAEEVIYTSHVYRLLFQTEKPKYKPLWQYRCTRCGKSEIAELKYPHDRLRNHNATAGPLPLGTNS